MRTNHDRKHSTEHPRNSFSLKAEEIAKLSQY
jgi:hypothetical protein